MFEPKSFHDYIKIQDEINSFDQDMVHFMQLNFYVCIFHDSEQQIHLNKQANIRFL